MTDERHVRLTRDGRNQVLTIPPEFELSCDYAIVRKDGERLTVEPEQRASLLAVLAKLAPISEEFPDVDASLAPLDDPSLGR